MWCKVKAKDLIFELKARPKTNNSEKNIRTKKIKKIRSNSLSDKPRHTFMVHVITKLKQPYFIQLSLANFCEAYTT